MFCVVIIIIVVCIEGYISYWSLKINIICKLKNLVLLVLSTAISSLHGAENPFHLRQIASVDLLGAEQFSATITRTIYAKDTSATTVDIKLIEGGALKSKKVFKRSSFGTKILPFCIIAGGALKVDNFDSIGQIITNGPLTLDIFKIPKRIGSIISGNDVKFKTHEIVEKGKDEGPDTKAQGIKIPGIAVLSPKAVRLMIEIIKRTDHYLNTITIHKDQHGVEIRRTETGHIFQKSTFEKNIEEIEVKAHSDAASIRALLAAANITLSEGLIEHIARLAKQGKEKRRARQQAQSGAAAAAAAAPTEPQSDSDYDSDSGDDGSQMERPRRKLDDKEVYEKIPKDFIRKEGERHFIKRDQFKTKLKGKQGRKGPKGWRLTKDESKHSDDKGRTLKLVNRRGETIATISEKTGRVIKFKVKQKGKT